MHSFEVHSNENACRKSGRIGLEQVAIKLITSSDPCFLMVVSLYGLMFNINRFPRTGPSSSCLNLSNIAKSDFPPNFLIPDLALILVNITSMAIDM